MEGHGEKDREMNPHTWFQLVPSAVQPRQRPIHRIHPALHTP
jgi:hypothetical protein